MPTITPPRSRPCSTPLTRKTELATPRLPSGAADFLAGFCQPAISRREVLAAALAARGVETRAIETGPLTHLLCGPPLPARGRVKFVVAHYDRVDGTPGANDNAASVWHLVDFAGDQVKRSKVTPWPADLRLLFTDGEELAGQKTFENQGAYHLGLVLRQRAGLEGFFTVLDMTGIGDTFVLGRAGEGLLAQQTDLQTAHPELGHRFAFNRLHSRRILAATGQPQIEIETPFSDDLGFLMAGLPAVQISLLPQKEALRFREARSQTDRPPLPPAWQTMHGPQDSPDQLWPSALVQMRQFLDRLRDYPLPRP